VIGRDAGDDARTIHQRALAKPVVGAAATVPPNVKCEVSLVTVGDWRLRGVLGPDKFER
jgi:hypothetical protein